MDINLIKNDAQNFQDVGDAYIHTEMRGGKAPRIMIAGGVAEMLWSISGVMHRIQELTGMEYKIQLIMLNAYLDKVEPDFKALHEETVRRIHGEDWQEKWKEETLKNTVAPLNAHIRLLQERIDSLEQTCMNVKKERDSLREKATEDAKLHRKEVMELEHRMQEIIDANRPYE